MSTISIPQWHDTDDILHLYYNPEYYERWYFDARFDKGYSCVATFHWRFLGDFNIETDIEGQLNHDRGKAIH